MNYYLTKEKGITLIAVVVAIIVLLIIAGVSISGFMRGNVLDKSVEASNDYGKSAAMDDIKIDIIAVQKKNNGRITENQFFETVEKYGVVSERDLENGYLTTTKGNFQIPLIELFDGVFSEELPDDIPPEEEEPDDPDPGSGGGGNTTPQEEPKGTFARYYPNVSGYGNVLVISNIGSFDFSKVTKRDNSLTDLYDSLSAATNYQTMINGTFEYEGSFPWQNYDIQYVITIGSNIVMPTLKAFFRGCKNLYHIDLSGCNLLSCTDASYMFAYTEGLDIHHFDVDMSAVRNMSYFYSGNKNTNLDISYIDIKNVQTVKGMFNDCSNLRGNVNDGYIKVGSQYTQISYFDLTSFDFTNINSEDGFKYMFNGTNVLHYVLLNKTWQSNYYAPNKTYLRLLYEYQGYVYQYVSVDNVHILEVD